MGEEIGLNDFDNHVNQLLSRICLHIVHVSYFQFLKFDRWIDESLKNRLIEGAAWIFEVTEDNMVESIFFWDHLGSDDV